MIMLQDQATESAISKTYLTTEPFIWEGEKGIGCFLTFHSHWSKKPKEMLAELASMSPAPMVYYF